MPCQNLEANYPDYIKSLLKQIDLMPSNPVANQIIKNCACRLITLTTEEGCTLLDEDGEIVVFPFCIQYAPALPSNLLNPEPWLKLSLKEAMFLYWKAKEFTIESFKWKSICWENKLVDASTVHPIERNVVDANVPGPNEGWFYNPQNYPNIYPILPYDPKKNVCQHILSLNLAANSDLEGCYLQDLCEGKEEKVCGGNGAWFMSGGNEVLIFRFDEAVLTKDGGAYFINVPVGSCMEGYRTAAGARRDGDGCDNSVSEADLVQTVSTTIEFQIDNKTTSKTVGLNFYEANVEDPDPDSIEIGKITVR